MLVRVMEQTYRDGIIDRSRPGPSLTLAPG